VTAYIANHEKKFRIFAKRERELLHAIKHDYSVEKIVIAAEKLRFAKLGVFKCRFSMNSPRQPHEFNATEVATHNQQVHRWLSMSAEEIVDLYRGGASASSD
jgi:hypothetical protein